MIRDKGVINVCEDQIEKVALTDELKQLPNGEYGYLLLDKERNKVLPLLKYLFGLVLKNISD